MWQSISQHYLNIVGFFLDQKGISLAVCSQTSVGTKGLPSCEGVAMDADFRKSMLPEFLAYDLYLRSYDLFFANRWHVAGPPSIDSDKAEIPRQGGDYRGMFCCWTSGFV